MPELVEIPTHAKAALAADLLRTVDQAVSAACTSVDDVHALLAGMMPETTPEVIKLVAEAAAALADVYDPTGVLLFWSARITYLDGKRPCDLVNDGDVELLERLVQHVNALADGAFA